MSLISIEQQAPFYLLTMHNEGKFNPDSLREFNVALDSLENADKASALIIHGEGKIFAQGLDLEVLASAAPDAGMAFVDDCMKLVGRLLCLPMPVVAAINGHAFGLGAMIALASDYKVMREDRGYFCLPEIDLGMDLIPSMNALIAGKLSGATLRDVLLTGKRIGGPEALQKNIVDACCPIEHSSIPPNNYQNPCWGKTPKHWQHSNEESTSLF